MAKTKEELDELKTEYESLKSKLHELNDEELKLVCGGSLDNPIVICSYICPICNKTHTFNMEWHGLTYGFDVISFNACSNTKQMTKIKGIDFPRIRITDKNEKTYDVSYTEIGMA